MTEAFPRQAPIIYVLPTFHHELLDQQGRVNDDCLRNWNIQSTLSNVTAILLAKFENRQNKPDNSQSFNQIINGNEDNEVLSKLTNDLAKKSIEELIYINFNQEEYIDEFTREQRENNLKLYEEVKGLAETTKNLKEEYEQTKKVIDDYIRDFQIKSNDLNIVLEEKKQLESKFSIENIINEMKKEIEEKCERPKKQIIADFFSKKINFETFKEEFKKVSQEFHYRSIIKDKMNIYK